MIAIGLDAGRDTGAAVVHVAARGTATWLASRVLDRDHRVRDLVALLDAHPDIELVAVEAPEGFPFAGRSGAAAHLVEAAGIGGELRGVCVGRGLFVVTCTANVVRRALCGRSSASDAMVKTMLQMRVRTLPKRCADHERDAAACAIWAAMGRRMERRTR